MATLSDMPWLGQPADPAGSLARGVQTGATIAQTRMQRESLAMRRMEFEAQQRERAAMLPLEMTLMQQDSEMKALNIEGVLESRQDRIHNESELLQLNKNVARAFTEAAGPEDAQQMLFESLIKNPRLISDPRFLELRKMVDTSLAAKMSLIEARNQRAGIDGLGGVTVVTDPLTGKQKSFVRTGSGSISDLGTADNFTPKAVTVNDPNTGKPITLIQTGPNSFREPRGEGEVIEFTSPTGERTSITRGGSQKTQGELTTATQTRLQEQSSINTEAITMLQEAISGIRATPSAIGVRGKVGTIVEQAKGQLQPNTPLDTPITDVRQKASIAFSRVAPALRIDSGNMSRYELNKLEQAGDVLGIEEAPQTAERKLLNLQSVVIGRQLRLLKTQGKPVPDEILKSVQGEEIAALIQAGLLTKEEATRLYQLRKQNGR